MTTRRIAIMNKRTSASLATGLTHLSRRVSSGTHSPSFSLDTLMQEGFGSVLYSLVVCIVPAIGRSVPCAEADRVVVQTAPGQCEVVLDSLPPVSATEQRRMARMLEYEEGPNTSVGEHQTDRISVATRATGVYARVAFAAYRRPVEETSSPGA